MSTKLKPVSCNFFHISIQSGNGTMLQMWECVISFHVAKMFWVCRRVQGQPGRKSWSEHITQPTLLKWATDRRDANNTVLCSQFQLKPCMKIVFCCGGASVKFLHIYFLSSPETRRDNRQAFRCLFDHCILFLV